jgi:phosphoserine aminotransferase
MTFSPPSTKPLNPCFGSGPTSKFPGWDWGLLSEAPLGRSHRSLIGKEKLRLAIEKTRQVLGIPQNYLIGIVPGSATGAIEMALWNLLGTRGVDCLSYDIFGDLWVHDIRDELKISDLRVFNTLIPGEGIFRDYHQNRDLVINLNGTTSGTWVNDLSWISDKREGLVIADGTSYVGGAELDYTKIDALCFSWQKAFGGEGAHGMLVLSPRAADVINSYSPSWPIPRIFRLKKGSQLNGGIFKGETINTPSMMCVEDYLQSLFWAESEGGIQGLSKRVKKNFGVIKNWVEKTKWVTWLNEASTFISNISPCLKVNAWSHESEEIQRGKLMAMGAILSQNQAAYEVVNHKFAPPSLRIWCGPTIETQNLELLLPWLEYAFSVVDTAS